jgi:hypothetical protein
MSLHKELIKEGDKTNYPKKGDQVTMEYGTAPLLSWENLPDNNIGTRAGCTIPRPRKTVASSTLDLPLAK